MIDPSEISDILKQQLDGLKGKAQFEEVGTVLNVGDGVAHVYGLDNVEANELVVFDNGATGVAMNLEESNVGVVLLDKVNEVTENMSVRRTGEIASIPVGEGLLGRVINVLGEPVDGKGPIEGSLMRLPLDRKAPGVIFRQPVKQPLQTGLKAVDSMIPIGRGQRELIIGDRQIGKTAIAIDTIINQRQNYEQGKPVYCIYVAIGQKASSIASLVNTLKKYGAMDYTVVVAASASDSAAMRYYSPFAGAAIGEFFRDSGRDALIVYDDLSKQAVAYRELSLILKRPSGREAYPGDIVGLPDNGIFKIGDTLTEGEQLHFRGLPSFSPLLFKYIENDDPMKSKQFQKGLEQLMNEGVAQLFVNQFNGRRIVGTVGQLQFEVIQYRLENEYNAKCRWEPVHLHKACWIEADDEQELENFKKRKYQYMAKDIEGRDVFLADSGYVLSMAQQDFEHIRFHFTSEF